MSGEGERSKSFRFLDSCPRALFEASEAGGWTPEFERLVNQRPETPTLLVFQADRPDKKHPSSMLPDKTEMANLSVRPYGTNGDMRYEVLKWVRPAEPAGELGSLILPWTPSSGPLAYPSNTSPIPASGVASGFAFPGTAASGRAPSAGDGPAAGE